MKWYFQLTPHDVWDYDATNGLIVADVKHAGKTVRAVVQPNRNGYVYVLDGATGKYLQGTQYVDTLNWARGLDAKGRPMVDEKYLPVVGGNPNYVCPGNVGGNNGAFTYPIFNNRKKAPLQIIYLARTGILTRPFARIFVLRRSVFWFLLAPG